ncbi:MAG: hypothetical protein EOP09_15280 [Proteobacteria bacterium]|nr:MAG: hypothetical protein EOP09_15280 [Pseudomonadota bacterium]
MRTYLAIFTCAENSEAHQKWMKLGSHEQAECMRLGEAAKHDWELKYKDRIVFDGGPVSEKTHKVDNSGVREVPSQLGAFMVVRAESAAEAAQMFVKHPHFANFPGDAVEILERLPTPRG